MGRKPNEQRVIILSTLNTAEMQEIDSLAEELGLTHSGIYFRCIRKNIPMYKKSLTDKEVYIPNDKVSLLGGKKKDSPYQAALPILQSILLDEGELTSIELRAELNKRGCNFHGYDDISILARLAGSRIPGFYEDNDEKGNRTFGIADDMQTMEKWDEELDRQILRERKKREDEWLASLE